MKYRKWDSKTKAMIVLEGLQNNQSTEEILRKIITKQLNAYNKPVTLESSFVDDLRADSHDIAELIIEFNDAFCDIKCKDYKTL
ncbi:MAG: acyl carrier protein [Candidatus Brocadiales bacterium]|nr:acyl carrier protein [Candidatus Brocadiales bacterium]